MTRADARPGRPIATGRESCRCGSEASRCRWAQAGGPAPASPPQGRAWSRQRRASGLPPPASALPPLASGRRPRRLLPRGTRGLESGLRFLPDGVRLLAGHGLLDEDHRLQLLGGQVIDERHALARCGALVRRRSGRGRFAFDRRRPHGDRADDPRLCHQVPVGRRDRARADRDREDLDVGEVDGARSIRVRRGQREVKLHVLAAPARRELDRGRGHEPAAARAGGLSCRTPRELVRTRTMAMDPRDGRRSHRT